ncbi:MAG: formyltetrahydrofolate deformylase [Puniceicoccaceae bacterium]|nr:MAG: formyltetrahydrofolate deformylase [Puniceicoccaceae bacterium]
MAASADTLIALLHGPDQPGLVAKTAGWIFERGGNILHADQHRDMEQGVFFQRIEWASPPDEDLPSERDAFAAFTASLGMKARILLSGHRPRVALMVSRADHCFHDLILRWKARELRCEICGILSNHPDLGDAAQGYGLPFVHIPVTRGSKPDAEAEQIHRLRQWGAELVVLARYMQILSGPFLETLGAPVINIHHSFLPAFAGARPYHQAHERGVKLIGATAHYVTAILDDGPIIHQDVIRVSHRHGVEDLIRKGRHLEKSVLAQAVNWHLENRVLAYGAKTVVFD